MNFIEHVNRWIAENRSALERTELLAVSDSVDTRSKRSVHVAVQNADRFAEVMVWDTGEAEFGFGGIDGDQSDEHHDLIDTAELDQLLARFLARVEDMRR